jgi:sulfonate transport system substrate-binding protein
MTSFTSIRRAVLVAARPLLAIALVVFPLASNAAETQPAPAVIRFGVSDSGHGSPPRIVGGWTAVAQVRHYLEDEFRKDGINVQWVFFRGQGPAVNEALTNNQLDFTTLGDLPSIIGRSVGVDTRIVLMSGSYGTAYVAVRPESSIHTITDLRGKRVSFLKGTASQLAANRILASYGLSERDVQVVNLDPGESVAAFRSGQLDAIFRGLGLLTLRDKGVARIIYNSKGTPDVGSLGHVLVTERFAKQYPQVTQRVVNALVRAAAWASDEHNRDQLFDLWAQAGSISLADFREEYQTTPLAQRLSPIVDARAIALDQKSVDDAYRFHLIRHRFDVSAWVDTHYLEASLKQPGVATVWATQALATR